MPLKLSEVSLAYPGHDAPALDRVSLAISPGERTILTGPSGAGKTSLLSLLLRFAEPTSGRIEAGGVSLGDIPLVPWRRQIAWVPQAPYLFAGTIADNIALGQPGAALEAIWHAADLAGAMDFVDALPGGLHAQLTERGQNLSAGQRQRIALARAFLRDSPLVLLDEPTAHLDPVSARRVLGVIEQLAVGRTVLMASHRRYPPARWKVIYLDHGRLTRAPSEKTATQTKLEAVGL